MGPKTETLCAKLRETSSLLRRVGEHYWAKWLDESLQRIENGDFAGITHLRGAFGGMGSFNDLILSSLNGHLVDDDDYRAVNEQLESLRADLYELSGYIQRNAEFND